MNKKIFLSLLLVLLIAISVSTVSAEAVADDAVSNDGIDAVAEAEDAEAAGDAVLADGEEKTGADIQTALDNAYKDTDNETHQAMEAFVHNLNTMHSRAGAQVKKVA